MFALCLLPKQVFLPSWRAACLPSQPCLCGVPASSSVPTETLVMAYFIDAQAPGSTAVSWEWHWEHLPWEMPGAGPGATGMLGGLTRERQGSLGQLGCGACCGSFQAVAWAWHRENQAARMAQTPVWIEGASEL